MMATVFDLDRLRALVSLLVPLSKMKPGQPITAEAWNTLVSTILELARTLVTHEQDSSVPPHSHEEQVAISWLDARLRSLVEEGPLADPAAVRRVLLLDRKVEDMGGRVDEAHRGIGEVRTRLSEVATRDLIREATLTTVGRKVQTMADGKDDVLALRRTLDTIQGDVRTAVDAAEKFKVGDEIADLGAISSRLTDLEALKDRLITPKGDLLDAMELEKRLAELNNRFVTQGELSDVLEGRLPEKVVPDFSKMKEELFQSVLEAGRLEQKEVTERLKRELLDAIPDVEGVFERVVVPRASSMIAEEMGKLQSQIPTFIERGLTERWEALVTEKVTATFAASKREIMNEVASQVSEKLRLEYKKPVFDDDFLVIRGIGDAYNEKLNKAGIYSYEDLGSRSAEEIGGILGLSAKQVIKLQIVEQAKELAARIR